MNNFVSPNALIDQQRRFSSAACIGYVSFHVISNFLYPICSYLFRSYSKHVTSGIDVILILLIVVGLGSAYFHGTLSFVGQLIDELAIAWVLLASFAIWTPKHMLPELFRRDRSGYVGIRSSGFVARICIAVRLCKLQFCVIALMFCLKIVIALQYVVFSV